MFLFSPVLSPDVCFALCLDQILQSTTIKEEKTERHVRSPLLASPTRLDSLGQPLFIVLDNEDDEDNQAESDDPKKSVNSLATTIPSDEQQKKRISSKKPSGSGLFLVY